MRAVVLFVAIAGCSIDVPLGFDDAGLVCPGVDSLRGDLSFGNCGAVTHDVAMLDNVTFGARGLAIDPQGRALLAGTTGSSGDRNIGVLRLLTTGAIDTTFGTNGVGQVSVTTLDEGHSVLLQPDGTIILAGSTLSIGNEPIPVLGKLLTSGIPDVNFGMGGHAKPFVQLGASGTCMGAWRRADGVIGCSGTSWTVFPGPGDLALSAVAQDSAVPVMSFGSNGGVNIDQGGLDQIGGAAISTGDDQLLIPGTSAGDFMLARVSSSGIVDTTFTARFDFAGGVDQCRAAFSESNGNAWCVGSATINGAQVGALVRVLSTGAIDSSFGTNGRVTLNAWNSVWAVLALDDGRFLLGGDVRTTSGGLAQALQVIDANGTESSALATFDVTTSDDSVRAMVRDASGRVWVSGTAGGDFSVRRFVPSVRRMTVAGECSTTGFVLVPLVVALLRRRRLGG